MKTLFALFFFLSTATIALGEASPATPAPVATVLPAEMDPPVVPAIMQNVTVAKLADCAKEAVSDITPAKLIALYPVLLVALRILSEVLGKLAATGSASANVAVVGLRYLSALLAWFFGKQGWGTPKAEPAQKLPKLKEMKAKAKEKAAAKAAAPAT